MSTGVLARLAFVAGLTACSGWSPPPKHCWCTPDNQIHVHIDHGGDVVGGPEIMLRMLDRYVTEPHRMSEGIVRMYASSLCEPCGSWVLHTTPIEQLFPLDALPHAVNATCLGLVMADGHVEYGAARPAECRR